jgi:hypothetical protein
MSDYKDNPDKYCSNWEAVTNFDSQLMLSLGEYVGHIPNYMEKIEKLNMEDFTKSKIRVIIDKYQGLVDFIEGTCEPRKVGTSDNKNSSSDE